MNGLGDLIAVVRKARGMTQVELGETVGVTQVAINRYESGDREPDDAMIAALSEALVVSERLLRHGAKYRGALAVDTHMRRQTTTKASLWRRAEARLNLLRIHASYLLEEISIHAEQFVPPFDADFTNPEDAARMVRAQWRMPIGPVVNLTRWVEAAGCLVFEEDFGTPRIDGLSQWVDDYPVIMLNREATTDRKRLTLAHELGHLVLHTAMPHEDMEGQANTFAAEFLMPEAAIRPELRRVDLGTLVALKREWGVSMQALFERAFRMGLVTASDRSTFYKSMNARGWRTKEPESEFLAQESPELPRSIGEGLSKRGLSPAEIADLAGFRDPDENPFAPIKRRLASV
jgi:Zn-dependent peptidase ImmA (M78 family)/DNA-binding XRE family transcriptional regulator